MINRNHHENHWHIRGESIRGRDLDRNHHIVKIIVIIEEVPDTQQHIIVVIQAAQDHVRARHCGGSLSFNFSCV